MQIAVHAKKGEASIQASFRGRNLFFLKGPELVLEGFVLERPSSSSKESSHD
jgi:hypothetical protein